MIDETPMTQPPGPYIRGYLNVYTQRYRIDLLCIKCFCTVRLFMMLCVVQYIYTFHALTNACACSIAGVLCVEPTWNLV